MADMDPRYDECARNAWLSPGSATVHKGEPTATESAKLWFHLTPDEDARLDNVLADSLARYKQLSADASQRSEHIAAMSQLMRNKGLDTPLTEVYDSRDEARESAGSVAWQQAPAADRGFRFRGSPSFDLG